MKRPPHHYVILPTFGSPRVETTEGPAKLEDLQRWVGGYIEAVFRVYAERPHIVVLANEEGRLEGLSINPYLPQYVGPLVLCRSQGVNLAGLNGADLLYFNMRRPA